MTIRAFPAPPASATKRSRMAFGIGPPPTISSEPFAPEGSLARRLSPLGVTDPQEKMRSAGIRTAAVRSPLAGFLRSVSPDRKSLD